MVEMKTLNGFEIVDNEARATISEHDEAIKLNADAIIEATGDIETLQTNVEELRDNVENIQLNYATQKYVDDKVANIEIPEPDLTEYVTNTELNNKGYLTEHQSLEGLATEKYVDDAISNIDIPDIDLSDVAPKEHTHSMSDITDYQEPDLSEYATKSEVPSKTSQITNDSDYTTKSYVDSKMGGVSSNLWEMQLQINELPTKSYVDNAVAGASGGSGGQWVWVEDWQLNISWYQTPHVIIVGNYNDTHVSYNISCHSQGDMQWYQHCVFAVNGENAPHKFMFIDGRAVLVDCNGGEVQGFSPIGFYYWRQ